MEIRNGYVESAETLSSDGYIQNSGKIIVGLHQPIIRSQERSLNPLSRVDVIGSLYPGKQDLRPLFRGNCKKWMKAV